MQCFLKAHHMYTNQELFHLEYGNQNNIQLQMISSFIGVLPPPSVALNYRVSFNLHLIQGVPKLC